VEVATGLTRRNRLTWGEPGEVAERKAERAAEAIGSEAKDQAGNVDPGMEAGKPVAVAGERKVDPSFELRSEKRCGVLRGIDPVSGENGNWGAERRSA
jgi:hypothetical protein